MQRRDFSRNYYTKYKKNLTNLNTDKFFSSNEELKFAKYYNRFVSNGQQTRKRGNSSRNPILHTNCVEREFKPSLKSTNHFNKASMFDKLSYDQIVRARKKGKFNDIYRPEPQKWKPHTKRIENYFNNKDKDDYKKKHGIKMVKKPSSRNVLIPQSLPKPEQPKYRKPF